ncbi:MAG: hypothetical protein M1G31_27040 [Pseudanabaena sp. Salubria-1]|nr:hypothetical protein [Pseudanabaena sp. Salubria-1]
MKSLLCKLSIFYAVALSDRLFKISQERSLISKQSFSLRNSYEIDGNY